MGNYRQDCVTALARGRPDITPVTFYDGLIPPGFDIAPLQAQGLAICARRSVYRAHAPHVKHRDVTEAPGVVRTYLETPKGTVTSLHQRGAYNAMAPIEHFIKTLDDYAVVEFIIDDTVFEPIYDDFLAEQAKIGETGITISHSGYSPLLEMQIVWIGQEQFCYELLDHEDAVMHLYEKIAAKQREMYPIAAQSPAQTILHCGNLVPEMLGVERVRDYVFTRYNEFADVLHAHGKQMGVHLDANNHTILELVRDSGIDLIEAFTPPPDCTVSVAQARAAWPGKVLWINFPSSVHLASAEDIRRTTEEILREAGDRHAFLIGVTEDIPAEHIYRSMGVILEVVRG